MNTELTIMLAFAGVGFLGIVVSVLLKRSGKRESRPRHFAAPDAGKRAQAAASASGGGLIAFERGKELSAMASGARSASAKVQKYNEAALCFEQATREKPNLASAWEHLGETRYALFRLGGCSDRLPLINAQTAFATATSLAPSDAGVWQNWGEELYMTAAYTQNEELRLDLQDTARTKYAKAVELRPELMEQWRAWGGPGADFSRFSEQKSAAAGEAEAEEVEKEAPLDFFGPGVVKRSFGDSPESVFSDPTLLEGEPAGAREGEALLADSPAQAESDAAQAESAGAGDRTEKKFLAGPATADA